MRWKHPERGVLMPSQFIPIAEETGLIVPIGAWVLDQACRQLAAWRASGAVPEEFKVSVNLSMRQLSRDDLADTVAARWQRNGLPASCLCLEVTESSMAHDPERAASVLDQLKSLGVVAGPRRLRHRVLVAERAVLLSARHRQDRPLRSSSGSPTIRRRRACSRPCSGWPARPSCRRWPRESRRHPSSRLLLRLGCEYGQGFMFARPVGSRGTTRGAAREARAEFGRGRMSAGAGARWRRSPASSRRSPMRC